MTAFENATKAKSKVFEPYDPNSSWSLQSYGDQASFAKAAQSIWGPAGTGEKRFQQPPLAKTAFLLAQNDGKEDQPAAPEKRNGTVAAVKDDKSDNKQRFEKSLQWLEKAAEIAERTDTKKALENLLEGQTNSINIIETLANPSGNQPRKVLENILDELQSEKWQHYRRYLDPSLAKAAVALAKISSGDDDRIKEGEKSLIAIVKAQPALQFDEDFQKKILAAYTDMETARQKKGLPPWSNELKPEQIADGKNPQQPDPFDTLSRAGKAYSDEGIKAALPLFDQAITEAGKLPQDRISNELSELFCKRLTIERSMVARQVRKENTDDLSKALEAAKQNEFEKYQEYLAPATMKLNAACAMISSGDMDLLIRGKKLLGQAIQSRPELEFNQDLQKGLRAAFQNHFKNRPPAEAEKPDDAARDKPKREAFAVGSKPFQVKDLGSGNDHDLENDKELKTYLADRVTGPILTVALLYLGYRVTKNQVQRIRAKRAAAAEAKAKSGTENKTEEKPGEDKSKEDKGKEDKSKEEKAKEDGPKGDRSKADEKVPNEPSKQSGKTEAPKGSTAGGDELKIETSPFESTAGREAKIDRPTNAMEAGKMIEIRLPGGLVAQIAKADAPKFLEKMEREFKTEEMSKFFDEMANDKNLPDEERAKYKQLKENYDKADPAAKEDVKAEFFEKMRTELGIEAKADEARSGRVGRCLGYAAVGLSIAILTAAFLKYTMAKARAKHVDRVPVKFIKKD